MPCCHPTPTPRGPQKPFDAHPEATASLPVGAGASAHAQGNPSIVVPRGHFAMGDHWDEGYHADGEKPVHRVDLAEFSIDSTLVTNTQFAAFSKATGYVTQAEDLGASAVFFLGFRGQESEILAQVPNVPWWLSVEGAHWRNPGGSDTDWRKIPDHPVVHVTWKDAQAYCRWAGRLLPTEAQWEKAARGGSEGRRYAWGDELTPDAQHQCNIWQGQFPFENTAEDGYETTSPVHTFPPNGLGLFDPAGNVWQWCRDWFAADYYRRSPAADPPGPELGPELGAEHGEERVIRGGSHLCHHSYCNRYRVSARSHATPDSSSSNTGFRTVSA